MTKEIDELILPDTLRYTDDHEWVGGDADKVTIGINDYAQDQLGDIVFVELPGVGDTFARADVFATVESVKAVSEIYMPVGGTIIAVNGSLEDAPELVNSDPYGEGWLVQVKPDDITQMDTLLTGEQAHARLKGA